MILPDRLLKLINPADRPKGPAGLTAGEAQTKFIKRSEREEQRLFSQWLLSREFERVLTFNWSRTDKKATQRIGWPDFQVLYQGHTLFLEFKLRDSRFSPEQIQIIERLTEAGFLVAKPESAGEAIETTKKWMASCSSC
jgi:hypothetical protein